MNRRVACICVLFLAGLALVLAGRPGDDMSKGSQQPKYYKAKGAANLKRVLQAFAKNVKKKHKSKKVTDLLNGLTKNVASLQSTLKKEKKQVLGASSVKHPNQPKKKKPLKKRITKLLKPTAESKKMRVYKDAALDAALRGMETGPVDPTEKKKNKQKYASPFETEEMKPIIPGKIPYSRIPGEYTHTVLSDGAVDSVARVILANAARDRCRQKGTHGRLSVKCKKRLNNGRPGDERKQGKGGKKAKPGKTKGRPGDNLHTTKRPGDNPHTSKRPGDNPYTTKRPGDNPHATKRPGDNPHTTKRPGDNPHTTKRPGDNPHATKRPGDNPYATKRPGDNGGTKQVNKRPGDRDFGEAYYKKIMGVKGKKGKKLVKKGRKVLPPAMLAKYGSGSRKHALRMVKKFLKKKLDRKKIREKVKTWLLKHGRRKRSAQKKKKDLKKTKKALKKKEKKLTKGKKTEDNSVSFGS